MAAMTRRYPALLAALLAGAVAGLGLSAPATRAATADPPPPVSLTIPDVEAWASAYLHRDAWTLITHDIEGAHFTRIKGATATGPHMVEADVRTELFQPVQMGSGLARSGIAHWSVNCATSQYMVLSMTIYAHNNMQGELARKTSADKAWMTPIDSQVATIGVICKAILGGTPFERRPFADAT